MRCNNCTKGGDLMENLENETDLTKEVVIVMPLR